MLLRILRGTFVFVSAVAAFALVPGLEPGSAPLHAQDDASAVGLTKEGIREYKKGNYEKAIQKLDEALGKNPTDEEARKMRDEVGADLAGDWTRNKFRDPNLAGRFERLGKWVLLGRSDAKGRNNSAEEIKKFVDDYMGDADVARNMQRAMRIRDAYGDFVIPYVQENFMHSENADARNRARVLLGTINAQAVPALVQVMQSTQVYDRQTAALALGDIVDPRALPVLAERFQDAAEDQQVREAARMGIEKIRALHPEKDKQVNNARDLWFMQAEGFYRNNAAGRYYRNRLVGGSSTGNLPIVMYGADRSYTVWRWMKEGDNGKLVAREVPLWAYADLLAEESALQALALGIAQSKGPGDAFVQDTQALLACIRFHIHGEAMDRLHNGEAAEKEFINTLMGEDGVVAGLIGSAVAASTGSPTLYVALERSLVDGYPEVSIAICAALAALGDRAAVGTPAGSSLFRALAAEDKRVRYAAACALVQLGANKDFGKNKEVEEVVIRNLQETAARSVLVICEDEALRNRYLSDIESLGISATGANSLERGADLATSSPVYDAIIVQGNLVLAPVSTWEPPQVAGRDRTGETRMETLLDLLSKDIRTKVIPLLVACRDDEKDGRKQALAGRNIPDAQFVSYSAEYVTDSAALGETLRSIWDSNPESAKSRANRMVTDMAAALAGLDPATTKFSVEKLLTGLSGGLRLPGRDPAARAGICAAITRLVSDSSKVGAAWVRQNVVANLLDTINSGDLVDSPAVKASAARALGACYGAHKGSYDEDGYKALLGLIRLRYNLAGVQDEAQKATLLAEVVDARRAGGEALGRAPATDAQRAEAATKQAIIPHEKPPEIPAGG